MMKPFTVSVVMSVYNDAARVPQAVECVFAQTFADWELVIVNDGSTDNTSEVIDALASSDSRICILHQENTGLTRALIRGCREARGEYIARHDADDISHPHRLADQLAVFERHPSVGFVACWTQYVGPDDEPLEIVTRPADSVEATRQLIEERQGPPAHGSVMFRKSLYQDVGGYRPEFYFGQDSDLWLRMIDQASIGYVPRVLYKARRDSESVSGAMRSIQRQFGELGHACRQARLKGESEAPFLGQASRLADEVRAGRSCGRSNGGDAIRMQYLIGSQLAVRGDGRARRYLWRVVRKCPWHWRAWARLLQASCPIKKSRCAETTSSTVPSPSGRGLGEGQENCEVVSAQPQSDGLEDG